MEKVVKTINDLCTKITDGAHNSPVECPEGLNKMYSSKDMTYNSFDDSSVKLISLEDYQKLVNQDCQPQKNDILIIKDGANYLKYVFKIPDTIEAVILSSIAILRPNLKVIDPDYFVYLLRTGSIRNAMSNYVSGAAIPRIVLKDFKRMKLNIVANLSIQKSIANVLLSFDKLIEANTKRIKILEQMAEDLYKEWFVRFRFPGHENAEFKNGKPISWKQERLEEFGITLDSGSRPSGGIDNSIKEGVPSIGAESVRALGEFDYEGVKLIPEDYYSKLRRGKNTGEDILVYKDGAYIGKVTIFMNGFPYKRFAVNEHVFLLNANNKLFQYYLYFTLHMPEYFALMQNLNRNAAQPGLSKPDMKRIKILVPDSSLVHSFNVVIKPILDEIFKLSSEKKILQKQRDLLLPRLMSGKLEV